MLVGLINLIPLTGVLGSERLFALYGLPMKDPNLLILMTHRSVLFGLLGMFLITAAWKLEFQVVAFFAGLVSMISFILLAKLIGNYNTSIKKVVWIDVIGSIALLIAWILYYIK